MPGEWIVPAGAARDAFDRLVFDAVRPLPARSPLGDRSAPQTRVHILVDGWACRYAMLADGRRRIVAFYLPGDICDFDMVMAGRQDRAIATITPTRVASVDRDALAALSAAHREIGEALWTDALGAVAIQSAWTINVGHRAANQRLAHLLCELYVRLERIGLAADGACALPLTQFHLADACALTAIHTNRALQELRRDGLLSLESRCLTIHDRPRLEALAAFDPGYLDRVGVAPQPRP